MPPSEDNPPGPPPPDRPDLDPPAPRPAAAARTGRVAAAAVTGAALAGVVAWLGGEAVRGSFDAPLLDSFHPQSGQMGAMVAAAVSREATVAFGLLGGVLGLAMGVIGGVARRSTRAALESGGLGLALGAAAGAGAAAAMVPVYLRYVNRDGDDLLMPLLTHEAIAAAIGAASGLALGAGMGGRSRLALAALGGLLGALTGALLFQTVGAFVFPLAQTGEPISATWGSRLAARLTTSVLAAAGAILLAQTAGQQARPGAEAQ
jgi:hypothetical protein